jgi:hypothetical protein
MGRVVLAAVAGGVLAYLAIVSVPASSGVCHIRAGLPDRHCTRGATSTSNRELVCRPNFRGAFRDTRLHRAQVYELYGISLAGRRRYVLDRLVPPELGGSSKRNNLWPLPRGARITTEKRVLMARLRRLVCDGSLPLALVQQQVARNWRRSAQLLRPPKR